LPSVQKLNEDGSSDAEVNLEWFLIVAELIMVGEHLDLTEGSPVNHRDELRGSNSSRRFVGVHFVCCDVYTRVYINRDATAYEGNCPKCAKRVRLRIGPGGTDARFFTAG
jgi:hypothetical protein